MSWEGHVVLPGGQQQWGADILPEHARRVKADLVITLMDAFVLDAAPLNALPVPVAHWLPVDCSPLSRLDAAHLKASTASVIAMSGHGAKMLTRAGFPPAATIPHGVDTAVFAPPADRDALRRELGLEGRFVIGLAPANNDPYRKAVPEQLAAFARLAARHDDVFLSIHGVACSPTGLDIPAVIADLGLEGRAAFSDQYGVLTGQATQADMARWFGALDLLSCCSRGEGFGLPVLEAAACGTPSAVTRASAMPEVAGPAGWKVAGEPDWSPYHQAWWVKPSVAAIHRAYEDAYRRAGGRRRAAREHALNFDADAILTRAWKPLLEALEEEKTR